jgi:leucyl-tRNA synthetase
MDQYDYKSIESKWAKVWKDTPSHLAEDFSKKPKFYALVEFPYPSGEGLHLGHAFTNVILDIFVRRKRMTGFNVLYPMGWDAFGLPTENYAIKTGIQPAEATNKNTDRFKLQMDKLALSYNWSREINTTDPNYFKWTQWIFLRFFEKGLAYKGEAPVGWCPSCKIILANEEVLDNKCERCGAETEQRLQKQWMLKITAYADRLTDELDLVDYPASAKLAQRNWIGKKDGVIVKFENTSSEYKLNTIEVFTTRIDTIFGSTFIVLAPEHPLAREVAQTKKEVADYLFQASKKSEVERKESVREKTGINTELKVINPINGEIVPVWVSDFVLSDYGTGAIMGVPAHDDRDKEFAEKYRLPIKVVVENDKLINSGKYSGLNCMDAQEILTKDLKDKATKKTTYHLRDWIFSRQHYWGEPIPIIDCPKCGLVHVPEDQLPLKLPTVEKYQPTENGESPLANISNWVNTTCPKCGSMAKRETDTMPNWAGSSWYYLRYCDPSNNEILAASEKLNYWMPVDLYLGGAEHTTLHLLYSRFWHKFLNDIGIVPGKEPYMSRRQHGIILAEDGSKMSKSKGNVINPDDMIEKYGCDTLRTYLAFMGPYNQTMPWSMNGIEGSKRFVNRIWNIFQNKNKINTTTSKNLSSMLNKTISKVGSDIDNLKHNTAVAALMTFLNEWEKKDVFLSDDDAKKLLIILSPFTPHLAEELWHFFDKNNSSVHEEEWPIVDISTEEENITIVVMIDGKRRSVINLSKSVNLNEKDKIEELAKTDKKINNYLESQKIKRVVYIAGRAINFVTR